MTIPEYHDAHIVLWENRQAMQHTTRVADLDGFYRLSPCQASILFGRVERDVWRAEWDPPELAPNELAEMLARLWVLHCRQMATAGGLSLRQAKRVRTKVQIVPMAPGYEVRIVTTLSDGEEGFLAVKVRRAKWKCSITPQWASGSPKDVGRPTLAVQ